MREFHRRQRIHQRARTWLSALALASVSTVPLWANVQVAACGSDEYLQVDDATGLETLKAAVNCSDGGKVVAVWSGDLTLESPVLVESGTFLTVLGGGGGGAVARGGSQTRLFEVSAGAELTLNNLRLAEGNASQGGAIHSSGSLTLDTCEFVGNVATANGGAVWASDGNVTISGVKFSNNSAASFGGAVFTLGAELVIDGGALFDGNHAEKGGAVFCNGSYGSSEDSLLTAPCTLRDASFVRNNAKGGEDVELSDFYYGENPWGALFGGGAATFLNVEANIMNCDFFKNNAVVAGGALFGGNTTKLDISGCTFQGNSAVGVGGAVAASSVTFGGRTELRGNNATSHGGGIALWDDEGKGIFNDFTCVSNTAEEVGGCLFVGAGNAVINDEAVMQGNNAYSGGCIYAYGGSHVEVAGGTFKECRCSNNGGFLFASAGSEVKITGGNIVNNTAVKRGAGVYGSGPSSIPRSANVTITGGTFDSNTALELGGALCAWGTSTVITIKGGIFKNNIGYSYGGFIFLEEEASLSCEGATIAKNHAGDRGGGIYAQQATVINSSCNLISNEAPQGAAAYLTSVKIPARFESISIIDNVASGGSVFYVAKSSVVMTNVTFDTSIGIQEDSSNRAVQLDEGSTLFGDGCVFTGWLGDTVVRSANPDNRSLVLNSCDFRGNSASMMVVSPHSDAEIRNALVDEFTLANAAVEDGSVKLVDRALDCSAAGACGGEGGCVDSVLGVLCVCIDEGNTCLIEGGTLELDVITNPGHLTYNPNPVQFNLTVSAKKDGITLAIWALRYKADGLELEVVPDSGVLPPGENLTVIVTGTPVQNDIGGNLASTFTLYSVGNESPTTGRSGEIDVQTVEVRSTFYLCQAFQYAKPADGDTSIESVECKQCALITGAKGVDCSKPGATQASLPIKTGYWRANGTSLTVHSCLHSEACKGAAEMTSSEDYCANGYQGPLCTVCNTSFGRGAGYSCHSCRSTRSAVLITAGSLFTLSIVLLFVLTTVFLVGGLDAVDNIHQSLTTKLSIPMSTVFSSRPVPSVSEAAAFHEGPRDASFTAALNADSEPPLGAPNSHASVGIGRTTPVGATFASPKSAASIDGSYIGKGSMKVYRSHTASKVWTEESRSGKETAVCQGKLDFPGSIAAAAGAGARAGAVGSRGRCCGIGQRIKRLWSRLPLDKLKILVVVWQILTVFPRITAVDFPPVYSRFLSWIDVINFDLGNIFSASCVFPGLDFYQRLLVTTLTPIALFGVLVVTYQLAKRRAGIGMAGIVERRAAWSRHMATGLLLTFLVFTSTSTIVFKTFGCDKTLVDGESYLRADYSLSCKTSTHNYYRVYAGFMLLVYPIGIPLLYAIILRKNRHLLNPRLVAGARANQGRQVEQGKEDVQEPEGVDQSSTGGQRRKYLSSLEEEELEKMVKLRRTNPDLVPSMFLWKDFGPDLYYYEVIECGRRILLTGVLIFIAPYTASQVAAACIFAFVSLLCFEMLRPHLDPMDSWLYRLGCVVIFLSNFLALLIKVDAAGEENGEKLGALLVTVNVMLVVAVILTSWFSTQQQVDDAKDDEPTYNMAMEMLSIDRLSAEHARLAREAVVNPLHTAGAFHRGVRRMPTASVWPKSSLRTSPLEILRSGNAEAKEEKYGESVSVEAGEELW